MSVGLATRGYIGGGGGGGTAAAPTLSNFSPDISATPGDPGAFSASFRIARLTPIEFDIGGLEGNDVTISVAFADRNERYVALDVDGVWSWPFDVEPDNSIGDITVDPAHVTLLPRGGWPPCALEIKVAACKMGEPA